MSPQELQDISKKYSTFKKIDHYESLSEDHREIVDRIDYELVVVDLMGYNAYFIIVADFINWAKRRGIAV